MMVIAASAVILTLPPPAIAQHHHYKLIVIGTLGGPNSYGDPGAGGANISNRGMAVGTADTANLDPNFPNFNPNLSGTLGGVDPFIFHVFQTRGGVPVDLGALPGSNNTAASWITDDGLVSGESSNGTIDPLTGVPTENAVLWKDGKIINLGTLGGYEAGAGYHNSRVQVVGFSSNTTPDPCSLFGVATQTRAFMWENGKMKDLGTLGGPDAAAVDINEKGQVAGISYTNSPPNPGTGCPTVDPFLWDKGKMIDLGSLGGTFGSTAEQVALNNRGQVVGVSNLAGDVTGHAFLWPGEDGKMRDLGTLGGNYSEAKSINDAGEISGVAETADSIHGFFWKNGQMTDIGTLDGDCFSYAFEINNRGQVVGDSFSCEQGVSRPYVWEHGQMTDLTVFVPPGAGVTLVHVEKINDRGEIFGDAVLANGDGRAFILIPEGDDDAPATAISPQRMAKSSIPGTPSASAMAAARAQLARRRNGSWLRAHLGARLAPK
jgi:probable HAF family extracellular repeat protein